MGRTPGYKVYDADGIYQAAARDATIAAAIVSLLGDGARVKFSGRIIWREGSEPQWASESYDWAADVMVYRIRHGNTPYMSALNEGAQR